MIVVLIIYYFEEMFVCDVLNVFIEGNIYYLGDIKSFIE